MTINLNLTGDKEFELEVFDTWSMKTIDQKTVSPGEFKYVTEITYTAIQHMRK